MLVVAEGPTGVLIGVVASQPLVTSTPPRVGKASLVKVKPSSNLSDLAKL